jgi:hypothetical protein
LSAFTEQLLEVMSPVLHRGGFAQWWPEGKGGGGMFYFRRHVGRERQLFELQLDKHGRRACFVNLARLDSEIVTSMFEGDLPADQVTTAHIIQRCRLKGNSLFGSFKPSIIDRLFDSENLGRHIGRRIIGHFDEVNAWFSSGAVSPRLHVYTL